MYPHLQLRNKSDPCLFAFFAEYQTCGDDKFQCTESHQCISVFQKCDGYPDCEDRSDESNATCAVTVFCGNVSLWQCGNGVCIDKNLLCNSQNDCGDMSDEQSCSKYSNIELVLPHGVRVKV